jgi:uncharacterized membrane protein (DUF2068 family)
MLRLIAAFKLFKGLLLVALAMATLKLVHRDVADVVESWARHLHLRPERHVVSVVVERLGGMETQTLETAAAGMLVYAALLMTEGVGLFLRKTWAEYFTIIVTGAFIPLEIYEIVRHVTSTRVGVVVVNVVIVGYLVGRVRRERATAPHP